MHFCFYLYFLLLLFFVVVHRSSSSVLSFLCVFAQTLTNAQFHTNVYKYVKYIAQSCCESIMAPFFFLFFLGGGGGEVLLNVLRCQLTY